MFKINKDLIFWILALTWLTVNIVIWKNTGNIDNCNYSNTGFIIIFTFLILLKKKNKKFNNWLNKNLWKNKNSSSQKN